MVGAVGNVCAHSRTGVAYGSAVLYLQALNGIGIVGTPYLRRIIKHSRVKSCTAARAVLQQYMGIIGGESAHKVIYTKDVSVPEFALSFDGECG